MNSFNHPKPNNILCNKFINDNSWKIEYLEVENKKLDESKASVSLR